MALRSHWCSRGGLVTVVKARSYPEARAAAHRAFRRGTIHRWDDSKIRVRRASRGEIRAFNELLAQQEAGAAGASTTPVAQVTDIPLFDVA